MADSDGDAHADNHDLKAVCRGYLPALSRSETAGHVPASAGACAGLIAGDAALYPLPWPTVHGLWLRAPDRCYSRKAAPASKECR